MNITSATGGTNPLQSTDASVLLAGTSIATVGIKRHRPTIVEDLTEGARQKIDAAKARATGIGTILDRSA